MTNFAFIDVNTQKCFVEHFGKLAIEDCTLIRENLMHLSSLAIEMNIPVLSPVYLNAENCPKGSNDFAKTLDTELNDRVEYKSDINLNHQQYIFEHENLENSAQEEILELCQRLKLETVYLYGVPLESSVLNLALFLKDYLKVWIIKDCVKATNPKKDEESMIKSLKKDGVKSMSCRMLDKFLKH